LRNARAAIPELAAQELIEQSGDQVCLTLRGRLLSNEVFQKFLLPDEVLQ
jgi:hypothetical protein